MSLKSRKKAVPDKTKTPGSKIPATDLAQKKWPGSLTREAKYRKETDSGLSGKVALVTGGAKRIGREIALALADAGAHVVVHCRRSVDEARKLCLEIGEKGVHSWVLSADLSDEKAATRIIPAALESAGRLDILVNNASVFTKSSLTDLSYEDLSSNVRVNAWAPFLLGREFHRLCGRGALVNILDSRIAGYDNAHLGYILSKLMLESLTRYMALEFSPRIRVNGVAPGLILPPPGESTRYLEKRAVSLPLKRHGSPRDVAEAVVYLLKSGFVTGQVIYVDGGRRVREK